MKTTLNLDTELLAAAKRRAAEDGSTLTAFIEDALRSRLLPKPEGPSRFKLSFPTVRGRKPPAIDVADRQSLLDLLDERA